VVIKFLSLASKWLCNKRYLQFNVVSPVVVWSNWNNWNNLVFNQKTWIYMKHVLVLSYTFQGLGMGSGGTIQGGRNPKNEDPSFCDATLRHTSFKWISS
jgi:hypothetical protein